MSIFNHGFIFLKKWNLAGIICIVPPGSKSLSLMFGKFQDPGVKVDWKNNHKVKERIPLQMTQNPLNLLCWTAVPWNTWSDGQLLGTCGSTQTGPLGEILALFFSSSCPIFIVICQQLFWELRLTNKLNLGGDEQNIFWIKMCLVHFFSPERESETVRGAVIKNTLLYWSQNWIGWGELWPFRNTQPLMDPACSSFTRQRCFTPGRCWLCSAAEDALFQCNHLLNTTLIFQLTFLRGSSEDPARPLNRYSRDMTVQICLTPTSTSCFTRPPNDPGICAQPLLLSTGQNFQGATVKRDKSTGAIVVARIMKGGAADKSGELKARE